MSEIKYNWKCITDEFKESCKDLKIGELLKEPNFGLFEAMSAIEMMDPKMDAGLLSNQPKTKIKTIEDAIQNNLLKLNEIKLDEKIAIIDNTLCNLITWIDGTSLAQTVFTNMYLHNPSQIEDKTIKWFSITVLKLIDHIRNKIINASVYEEEDFQAMHYGFKFSNEISEQVCVSQMKSVEDECAKYFRSVKSQQNDDANHQLQVNLASSILARVKFTRAFYQLMLSLNENTPNKEEIVKYCSQAKESLKQIETSHDLGVKPTIVECGKTNYPVVLGFEPSINQRLLPPTFPRYIKIHTFESTISELNKIIEEAEHSLELLNFKNFHQIFNFLVKFSDKKQSVLNRSINHFLLIPKTSIDKMNYMSEFLKETVKQFIEPPIFQPKSVLYNKEMFKKLTDVFFNKCSPVFLTILQILGNNRARQRDKFSRILEEFIQLQDEADNVDRILHTYLLQLKSSQVHLAYLGSWVLYNTLTIMILYLFFGFELELYSAYEYYYVYWYLSEILLNWQITTLTRVDNYLSNALDSGSNNKPNKKSKKKATKQTVNEKELTQLYAHRHMCSAFYQAIKAFNVENKIKKPNDEFCDEELRYEHRFYSFQLFTTPPLCQYRQFKEKDQQYEASFTVEKMYLSAQEHFEHAKNYYEELGEWNNSSKCAKVAKTNFVVLRLLASGMKKAQNIEFDFTSHPHYPIIRLI